MLNTIVQNTTDYSVDSYCKSKAAVALSLNVTHNWFDNIRNLCRNFLFLSLICFLNMVTFKECHTLLNDRLIPCWKIFLKQLCTVWSNNQVWSLFTGHTTSSKNLGWFWRNLLCSFPNKFAAKWCKRPSPHLANASTVLCETWNAHWTHATVELS